MVLMGPYNSGYSIILKGNIILGLLDQLMKRSEYASSCPKNFLYCLRSSFLH